MIELDNVVKVYEGKRIIDGVSMTIDHGAFWALVGPSGAGKSTTLKMINRIIPFTEGAIRIDGEDIMTIPAEVLRRRIGYAIQSIGLFPHWTIAENIATVPRLLKWPEARIKDRVMELLALLRLDAATYAGKYPAQLSGGQQQRVGVARALAADPDLLLMDEPFGALDPITRESLQAEMIRIHQTTGKTIVFVTHDMQEAVRLSTGIAVMKDGKLVQSAPVRDILERPVSDFIRDFVGRSRLELAMLGVKRVADRVRAGESASGDALDMDSSLSDALYAMLAHKVDRLPVVDTAGRPAGAILLGDILG